MGVLEPVVEDFEEVPATPPGVHGGSESEDDLFAVESGREDSGRFGFGDELSFRNIVPMLPSKGDFDLMETPIIGDVWKVRVPTAAKIYCSGCADGVRKDLKKLAETVEAFKNERDAVKRENDALKKEVEELKRLLKKKEEGEKGDVTITVCNANEDAVGLLVRRKNFENARNIFKKEDKIPDKERKYGIQSFSISAKEAELPSRKTVAELRREFFAKEFQSEQKTFTSRNFLEIKPEVKKDTVRSRLAIRVKPKQKITEIITKLTSKIGGSSVVPAAPKVSMFQRFEKTRISWQSDLEERVLA